MRLLRSLFGARQAESPAVARPHLRVEAWPAAIYAMGDIHGCAAALAALEARILEDGRKIEGEKLLIHLGDHVDRGPDSAAVLDRLMTAPAAGWRRVCLAGNHEIMMLDFLANPHREHGWLRFGGVETLASYGIDARDLLALPERQRIERLRAHIPEEHLDFLAGLALTLSAPGVVFVHAGLRPGLPLERQSADDLLWIRDAFFNAPAEPGRLVVHGHTPAAEPVVAPGRICVDTGAYATGILTALCLSETGAPRFVDVKAGGKVTLAP